MNESPGAASAGVDTKSGARVGRTERDKGIVVTQEEYLDFFAEELDARRIRVQDWPGRKVKLGTCNATLLRELEVASYRFERWYERLSRWTAESALVPLSKRELRLLLRWNRGRAARPGGEGGGGEKVEGREEEEEDGEKEALARRACEGNPFRGAVFVRTSECSAKDEQAGRLCDPTRRDWMELLARLSSSGRVRDSLLNYKEIDPSTCLVLRRFHPIPPWPGEFRCFVYDGRWTAWSPHNGEARVKRRDFARLFDLVQQGLAPVLEELPWSRAVVDIAFLHKLAFVVVECNPFHPVTGSLHFDWDQDSLLLQGALTNRVVFRQARPALLPCGPPFEELSA